MVPGSISLAAPRLEGTGDYVMSDSVQSGLPVEARADNALDPAAGRAAELRIPDDDAITRGMHASLESLVGLIERVAPGMRGSVLLLDDDGVTLRHGAAPHLPPAYCRLIDDEKIGPVAGSCGTAAYRRERVIVRDIATDPLWVNYRQAAEPFGLAACWSTPIFDAHGSVLGTFAMYYGQPREPTAADIELTETATYLAGNIISGARAATSLRMRSEGAERLADALRASEERLRSSQERLHAALDASSTSTWRWDMQTNVVDGDDGLFELFGVDPAEAAGSFDVFISRIHPEDRERVVAAAQRCATEGGNLDEVFRIIRPDGSLRWAVDKGKTVVGADGTPQYLIGACVDITDRRVRDEQFRALAESLPQLAWMADASGARDWFNARWYEYTGATPDAAQGWGWRDFQHPDHVDRVIAGIERSWQTGQPWEDTFPLRGRDGTYRWFLARAQPIRDADGRIVRWFGTSTDINERREAELAIAAARAEAERANKAKSEFLAAMSHDLRTPLNAIGGFADLTAEGVYGEVNDAQRHAMTRIRRAGDHLLTLLNDILTFAKVEAGRMSLDLADIPVSDIVSRAATMIEVQAAQKGLSFQALAGGEDVPVHADRERVTQILTNLLTNAVKFTAAGSITIGWAAGDRFVRIDVRDTGRGIPADRLASVFEPFVQVGRSAEERQQGVGLGLAISCELARAMGGELTVESVIGQGSTFTLLLPRAADASPRR
jgi:PAS domain S-box-containing protein